MFLYRPPQAHCARVRRRTGRLLAVSLVVPALLINVAQKGGFSFVSAMTSLCWHSNLGTAAYRGAARVPTGRQGLVLRASSLSVEELKARLRKLDLSSQGDEAAGSLGDLLADFIDGLEKATEPGKAAAMGQESQHDKSVKASPQPEPAPPAIQVQTPSDKTSEDPVAMLAELVKLDPRVSKGDYFDEEESEWDLEGLRDDLRLAKEESAEQGGEAELVTPEPVKVVAPEPVKVENEPDKNLKEDVEPDKNLATINVGDYVLAKYDADGGWYTAAVLKVHNDDSFQLKWDEDSTESKVSSSNIVTLPPIREGDKVKAIWEEDGGWYDGIIQKDNGDKTYQVKYTEDESVLTVKYDNIRKQIDPPKEVQYWAAPFVEGQPSPKANDRVEALYKEPEWEAWYPAGVVKDNGDGTFTLKWDEDETESSVPRSEIKVMQPRFSNDDLVVGHKYKGSVTNVADFGAFVDVGAENEGLVHISKIAQERVNDIHQYVSQGQVVDVWLERFHDGKLSFTMVQGKAGRGPAGPVDLSAFAAAGAETWFKGTVKSIAPFGLFVEVEQPNGGSPQTGMVHIRNVREGYVESLEEEFSVGQEVQVRVEDTAGNKLSLSMKPI